MASRLASREFCLIAENEVTIWGGLFIWMVYIKTMIFFSVGEKWSIFTTIHLNFGEFNHATHTPHCLSVCKVKLTKFFTSNIMVSECASRDYRKIPVISPRLIQLRKCER